MQHAHKPELLNTRQAAAELGISPLTLQMWRIRKKGKRYPLAYLKIGKSVRYSRKEIQKFLAANTHKQ